MIYNEYIIGLDLCNRSNFQFRGNSVWFDDMFRELQQIP